MQLAALSSLLLALHRLTNRSLRDDVRGHALELLEAHLPLSAAWWGLARLSGNSPHVLQGYLHRLPPQFAADWLSVADIDELAISVLGTPGITGRYLGYEAPDGFDVQYGIVSALSTAIPDEDTGLTRFLSIYRDHSLPLFTNEDRALVESLVPHLFLVEEQQERAAWQKELATQCELSAKVNENAWLEQASPAFCKVLMAEFPGWNGGCLPKALNDLIRSGAGLWQGRTLDLSASHSTDGSCHLSLKLRTRLGLTRREEMVARAYAGGLSYKEIARELGLAPATVRSYLQQCYLKLEVSNKVSLGDALRGGSEHRL